MDSAKIREKFLKFFEDKGHAKVLSSSLIPDDPSVLLTTAGMQQFKKYFTGELDAMKDFGSKNTVSIQKSFRTSDIDEVGDDSHLTFFEMLGNFSFGGYFKEDAIKYAHEFLAELGLEIHYVSVFAGDENVPVDDESEKIWRELGVTDIRKMGREHNFWGPTGVEGPCGPTTEIYVNGVEIWNIVFNEYYFKNGKLTPLEVKGVDTGMGLERLAAVAQKKKSIFETDLFQPLIEILSPDLSDRQKRILSDHARATSFLVADGVRPSNKEAGYILRRILRRMIVHEQNLKPLLSKAAQIYSEVYPELEREKILDEFQKENDKFQKTLKSGLRELNKLDHITASSAFRLYETFGLPFEIIKDPEIAGQKANDLTREQFDQEFAKHQEISRAGAEKKFGGHGLLLDTGEIRAVDEKELKIVTRLHTATHLLQAALREVLGSEVKQNGSDITAERTRFDFFFPRKLSDAEKKQVEDLVNQKIAEDLPVAFREMPIDEAKRTGALFFFKAKYGQHVKVYYMGEDMDTAFSKEFCGGPHLAHTGEVGRFKIVKEESVAAGIRRIRGIVQ